ncbi:MAG: hypothetical protein HY320_09975 [Armatimonadetes bacterium]|nr:hypothetical protein [Armatimonadota bacterium]
MPLSERARIEVYVPDLPTPGYQNLLDTLEQEFTYTFGGCTIIRGLHGSYLSQNGLPVQDRINMIYTDASIRFDPNLSSISRFTDKLKQAVFDALQEEAVLIAASKVYHAT